MVWKSALRKRRWWHLVPHFLANRRGKGRSGGRFSFLGIRNSVDCIKEMLQRTAAMKHCLHAFWLVCTHTGPCGFYVFVSVALDDSVFRGPSYSESCPQMRPPLTSSWSAHLITAFHVPLVSGKTCSTPHAIEPSRGFGAYTVHPFQQAMLHRPPRYPIVFVDLSTYFHSIHF